MQQNSQKSTLHGVFPCVRSLDFCLLAPPVHNLMYASNGDAFALGDFAQRFACLSSSPDAGVSLSVLFPAYFIAFFSGETGRRRWHVLIQPCQERQNRLRKAVQAMTVLCPHGDACRILDYSTSRFALNGLHRITCAEPRLRWSAIA